MPRVIRTMSAAALIAMLTVMFSVTVARADDLTVPSTGSITVVKHKTVVDVPPDGTAHALEDVSVPRVAGVEFAVAEVLRADGSRYDLTSPSVWQEIQHMKLADVTRLGPTTVAVTNSAGEAVFGDLPVGVYKVWETSRVPANLPADHLAYPSLVTLPLVKASTTAGEAPEMVYNVTLYPKNAVTVPELPLTPGEPLVPQLPPVATPPQAVLPGRPPMLALTGSGAEVLIVAGLMFAGGSLIVAAHRRGRVALRLGA